MLSFQKRRRLAISVQLQNCDLDDLVLLIHSFKVKNKKKTIPKVYFIQNKGTIVFF